MKKTEAENWAASRGWTKADAKRAFELANLSFPQPEDVILISLIDFAGPELKKRQGLQAAQKGQVTKKKKEITNMAHQHQVEIAGQKQKLEEERSFWRGLLATCYEAAQKIGFYDSSIEDFLYGNKQDDAA